MCDRFHCLPEPGSLLDQPVDIVRKLKIVTMGRRPQENESDFDDEW